MDSAKIKQTGKIGSRGRSAAFAVTRIAVMAGMLTALKLALSLIPNVEVVTLLILVYASVFGLSYAFPATVIFCAVEVAIYGAGSWNLLYFVYFPALAVAGALLLKKRRLWVAVLIAFFGSVLLGVLSACCDTLFVVGFVERSMLGRYWVAYYLRGLYFDLVHVVACSVSVLGLYSSLSSVAVRLKPADNRVRAGDDL